MSTQIHLNLPLDLLVATDFASSGSDSIINTFGIYQEALPEEPGFVVIGCEHAEDSSFTEQAKHTMESIISRTQNRATRVYVESINIPAYAEATPAALDYYPPGDLRSALDVLFRAGAEVITIDGTAASENNSSESRVKGFELDNLSPGIRDSFLQQYANSYNEQPSLLFPLLSRFRSQVMTIQIEDHIKHKSDGKLPIVLCGRMHVPIISNYFGRTGYNVALLGKYKTTFSSIKANPKKWVKQAAEAQLNSPLIDASDPLVVNAIVEKAQAFVAKLLIETDPTTPG